jgi:hypothetical protein
MEVGSWSITKSEIRSMTSAGMRRRGGREDVG